MAVASKVSLAVGTKLQKLFEQPDRFLAFPLGLGFSYDYLEFMKDPSQTTLSAQEQLKFKADFARLLNIIPEDRPIMTLDSSSFLWDRLNEILRSCIFAESALTDEQERALSVAMDFLTDEEEMGGDGTAVPINSASVARYYEYKTLCDEATRAYLDEKLTVEAAAGPDALELRQQWDSSREKELREIKEKAERDWINLGFKQQVEHNQSLRDDLEIKKYANLYGKACLDELEISEIADLNGTGTGFHTTFFSPADAFDQRLPWPSVTLRRREIEALANSAPSELRAAFGADQGDSGIESISLEYNNVVVIRPWLKPEFFQARCWNLSGLGAVSDGGIPRGGRIPAYITSMIVARNVRVTRRGNLSQQSIVLPLMSKTSLRTAMAADQRQPMAQTSQVRDHRALAAATVTSPVRTAPSATSAKTVSAITASSAKTSFVRVNVAASSNKRRVGTTTAHTVVRDHRAKTTTRDHREQYATVKCKGTTINRPPAIVVPAKPAPTASVKDTDTAVHLVTEEFKLDGVSVIAFVCKRVPKCPDPDPALRWPG